MPRDYSVHPTISEAQQQLQAFICTNPNIILSSTDKADIQQALLVLADASDYQILGICAESLDQGRLALTAYAKALGYEVDTDLAPVVGPVYIKFNPRSGLCYAEAYSGPHRGVLVSCQSFTETGVNEMIGHLPLDLFAA